MDAILLAFCYALAGAFIGSTLGLIPGMHSNNVALLLYISIAYTITPLNFGCLLMSMLVAHLFTSFIPSTFLGAPEGELALSVLPAHRLMLAGKGYDAVKVHAKGASGGIVASLLLIPFFKFILGEPFNLYSTFSFIIPFLLILIEFMLISAEPPRNEFKTKIVVAPLPKNKLNKLNNLVNLNKLNLNNIEPNEISKELAIKELPILEILNNEELIGERVTIQGKILSLNNKECIFNDGTASIKIEYPSTQTFEKQSFKKGSVIKLSGLVEHDLIVHSWQPRILALFYFLLTGIFGYFVLNSHLFNYYVPILLYKSGSVFLLPIFAGMFGIAGLLISLLDKPTFPKEVQNEHPSQANVSNISNQSNLPKMTGMTCKCKEYEYEHEPEDEHEYEYAKVKIPIFNLSPPLILSPRIVEKFKLYLKSNLKFVKGIFAGAIAGGLIGFYPGMSSAHASMIAKWASPDTQPEKLSQKDISQNDRYNIDSYEIKEKILENSRDFISMLSAVNSANIVLNLLALFVISKTRSGAMNYLEIVLGDVGTLEGNNIPITFSSMLFSAILGASFAFPITLFAGKIFATYYHKVDYEKLTIAVILFLILLVFLFSGPIGIFVMLIAVSIGISSQLLAIRRVHLMGCIALPVIIFYLF